MEVDPGACTERELTEAVALCRADGTLDPAAVGWARQPLIDCALRGSWGRRKRWDFWAVTGPGFAMNLTLADVDYLALADVWFRDFESGEEATAMAPAPLGRGVDVAPRAGEGAVERATSRLRLRFADDERGTTLASFATKQGRFEAEVLVARPPRLGRGGDVAL